MPEIASQEGSEPIGFYNLGVAYLNAARAAASVPSAPNFDQPVHFLVAHGLELIFKADIRRTRSIDYVRRTFGHNLVKLRQGLSGAFAQHFELDVELDQAVEILASGHSGPDWRNRYLQTGPEMKLQKELLLAAVRRFSVDDRQWLTSHFIRQVR